jgi:hypothetical protein
MTIHYEKDWVNEEWFTDSYQQQKTENFQILDQYLAHPPKTILDIGCGLAWESRLFNEKYGTKLYLLDGDYNDNPEDKLLYQATYVEDAQQFAFYYKLDFLKSKLDELDTKDYELVDCNHISLSEDIKFDLITSWVSCGFHYPVSTYRDLILKHSHESTVVVMDLRVRLKGQGMISETCFEVIDTINQKRKYHTSHIRII